VSLRRALVHPLPGAEPTRLDSAVSHHLVHVLRLQPGARVVAFDGRGAQVITELIAVESGVAIVRATGEPVRAEPSRAAHLVLGRIKPKALDLGLRMAVEAGITHLHLFDGDHSQGRPPREDRWERIAAAAATQCGRADLPTVLSYPSLSAALDALPTSIALFVATPGAQRHGPPQVPAAIIVGPEGGLSPTERERCATRGAIPVGLAAFTLRAETACAIAAAFVSAQD